MGYAIDKTEKLSSNELNKLAEKISDSAIKTCFFCQDDINRRISWSYIFSFSSGKESWLVKEDTLINGQPCGISTAATDGIRFYWNIDFLNSLTAEGAMVVSAHEVMHITLDHINRAKMEQGHRHPIIWNLAIDMAVNAFIVEASGRSADKIFADVFKAIGGNAVYDLKTTINMIKSAGKNTQDKDAKKSGLYLDKLALDNGAEWAYNEMMKHVPIQRCPKCGGWHDENGQGNGKNDKGQGGQGDKEGQGQGQGQGGQGDDREGGSCGGHGSNLPGSLDSHMGNAEHPEKTKRDILAAAQAAKTQCKGAGNMPGCLEDILGEIADPTLSVFDLIKSTVRTKAHNNGIKKNYKQYQKRPQWIYGDTGGGIIAPKQRMYIPTKQTMMCNYLIILDTSGSMNPDDMVFGLKEIKAMDDAMGVISHGWAIPLDSKVYWDAAVEINNAREDLAKIKPVGRGGTVFTEFFTDFGKHYDRSTIDLIICITDGDIFEEPPNPGIDTVWLLTNGDRKMPFGRKFDLRARIR